VAETILVLDHITKTFGTTEALRDVSLSVEKGEFLTLLGPSGCGKTTMLRIIAGLEKPDSGRVILMGKDVTTAEPHLRNVNTVFQSYALFPHMNVFNNIAYGLKIKGVKKDVIHREVQRMLELVQLPEYGRRMPSQLSGGQRQRVAIARAVINDPAVLLLDEPLGALDLQLRRQMQVELKKLQVHLGITFIYITHDQEEALNMSDRIVIMQNGQFEQIGTPTDIYERPRTRFAAQFIGQSNILETRVADVAADGGLRLAYGEGTVMAKGDGTEKPGQAIALSVRAERIDYGRSAMYGFDLQGKITAHSYIGGVLRTTLGMKNGQELLVTGANPVREYPVGTQVAVFWDPDTAAIVDRGNES
jgi:spermidine/putrescine transport system ATP-binding protein